MSSQKIRRYQVKITNEISRKSRYLYTRSKSTTIVEHLIFKPNVLPYFGEFLERYKLGVSDRFYTQKTQHRSDDLSMWPLTGKLKTQLGMVLLSERKAFSG